MESRDHKSGNQETPRGLWVSSDPDVLATGAGPWDSEPNSVRGSFRVDEMEESALCCSLSVSEDGLSEYSENQSHYSSECGSRKSGRGGSAGVSPLTTTSDRSSSFRGNRSLPSPAYLSSGVASSVVASGSTPSVSGSESSMHSGTKSKEEALSNVLENGGVSPKRRGHGRGGPRRPSGGGGSSGVGRGDSARGGWLGRPGPPPPRGQVFQSCLRPGIGVVRTIIEEDEEGWDDDSEVDAAPENEPQRKESASHRPEAIPTVRTEEKAPMDLGDGVHGKGHFFVRSNSDQSKSAGDGTLLASRNRGAVEKGQVANKAALHEAPGCLCPVANTPEGSSIAESPPGSPREERLTMAVYFCGLPGTGYGRRRRACGLCGRQVGRRGPQCSLCRLIVYCDRKCLEQHQSAHYRNCPGASAKRLREAASALRAAEKCEGVEDDGEDNEPLKRVSQNHEKHSTEGGEEHTGKSWKGSVKPQVMERSPLRGTPARASAKESPVASSPVRALVTPA